MADISDSKWTENDAGNDSPSPDGIQGGYAPSTLAAILRGTRGPVKREFVQNNAIYTTSGTSSIYALTFTQGPTAYVKGKKYAFTVNHTNTGPATLNINALGAKAIVRADGTPLTAGQLQADSIAVVYYDGTSFRLNSPVTHDVALSGIPTAPTATAGTNTTQLATTAYVRTAVNDLIPASVDIVEKAPTGTARSVIVPTGESFTTRWETIEVRDFVNQYNIDFLNLGDYKNIRFEWDIRSSGNATPVFTISNTNGATWITGSTDYQYQGTVSWGTNNFSCSGALLSGINLATGGPMEPAFGGGSGYGRFYRWNNAASPRFEITSSVDVLSTGLMQYRYTGGVVNSLPKNALRLSANQPLTGRFILEGLK